MNTMKDNSLDKLCEIERLVIANCKGGRLTEIIEQGDPASFSFYISFQTLLLALQETYVMRKCEPLLPILRKTNTDIFVLEYSIFWLSSCIWFLEQSHDVVSEKNRQSLRKKFSNVQASLSHLYATYYDPEEIYSYIDRGFAFYRNCGEKRAQRDLLIRLTECAGKKDFSSTVGTDFTFSSGVAFGEYVERRVDGLLKQYFETVDRGTRRFLDICFWFGYNDLDEG